MPLLRSLGGEWGAGATDRSLLTELGEGRMVVVSEPRPCLILGISAARRHPRPKAPEAWRSPGRWRVGRGRWKVAKRLGVRQSPAAFPRQGVEKGVGGRDAQDNGTTGQRDYRTTGQRDYRTIGLSDYRAGERGTGGHGSLFLQLISTLPTRRWWAKLALRTTVRGA